MSDDKIRGDDGKLLYCSFCGKSQHEVRKLIAGPSVFICDECVELCNDIIREEMQEGPRNRAAACQNPKRSMQCSINTLSGRQRAKSPLGSSLQSLQAS